MFLLSWSSGSCTICTSEAPAFSCALCETLQSTKLCVFEERVLEIVAATRDLPGNLATTGAFKHSKFPL